MEVAIRTLLDEHLGHQFYVRGRWVEFDFYKSVSLPHKAHGTVLSDKDPTCTEHHSTVPSTGSLLDIQRFV